MDWNSAIEDNRRMLKRIVAVLFAFAVLAERLTGLPRPVRVLVLRILRSAGVVARHFVFETQGHGAPLPNCFDALQGGDSPADALRLAQSFRVLALLLDWLAEQDFGRGKRCITPSAMIAHLLSAMSLDERYLLPATAQLAVERRDSS